MRVPHRSALPLMKGGHIVFEDLALPCNAPYDISMWLSEADEWNNDDFTKHRPLKCYADQPIYMEDFKFGEDQHEDVFTLFGTHIQNEKD